jgi:hypothetical protein
LAAIETTVVRITTGPLTTGQIKTTLVGIAVGLFDGNFEGKTDGLIDGFVGCNDDEIIVGVIECSVLGELDGTFVILKEGLVLGEMVG